MNEQYFNSLIKTYSKNNVHLTFNKSLNQKLEKGVISNSDIIRETNISSIKSKDFNF